PSGQREGRLVVVGDSDFASNAYFDNQANGDLFMNMISWLIADEDLIAIRPKNPEISTVNMTPAQTKTVMWLTVIILPAIAFGVAIMVYVRRK
ncbi:MAG TPA: ABC transporter, partial [Candidatus Marinimicrobia bacterium]|nr:ABC transporter [Candidatus Neomarinimicrobiota bacterium]